MQWNAERDGECGEIMTSETQSTEQSDAGGFQLEMMGEERSGCRDPLALAETISIRGNFLDRRTRLPLNTGGVKQKDAGWTKEREGARLCLGSSHTHLLPGPVT